MSVLDHCLREIRQSPPRPTRFGKVRSATGIVIEATGLNAAIGEMCVIRPDPFHEEPELNAPPPVEAEVIGIRGSAALLMPLGEATGLRAGSLVERASRPHTVPVGDALLGRVIDASGRPIDGKGPLALSESRPVRAEPPAALERQLIDAPLRTGVRAIDGLLTLAKGQRVGIFAGSGVGKSTLLGTIAARSEADINVIALIGERGREVREFIHDTLGEDGLARSVVVAVTGDQAALARVKGALVATAVAEHFRDQGRDVLLMMDSVTRVAQAQREIGLAAGEPPTTRGYTPSVFALLPRILERAGPGANGTITGLFTVLVDGGDMDEPVADAVRGILDGHIVLSRKLADSGHFPAIDVPASVSRVMPRVTPPEQQEAAREARALIAAYREVEPLVRVGAFEPGRDPDADRAVDRQPAITAYLKQPPDDIEEGDAAIRLIDALTAPGANRPTQTTA